MSFVNPDPYISVIIPVHNGDAHIKECLSALPVGGQGYEVIVVDDASTDESAGVARRYGARLLQLESRCGPAAARNYGARQARGEVLLFVDADVRVRPDTLARAAGHFRLKPELAALFGSYDDAPASKHFVSQYKNLFHHFVHQQARQQAETFWAGCGAVRRDVFLRLGGFDAKRYREPSIEDVELGYRLRREGCGILLDKQLQVQHLKRWTLPRLLHADIFRRAFPWSKLILERGRLTDDLNLRVQERVSAAATILALALLASSFASPLLLAPVVLLLTLVFILNRKMYSFFLRRLGPRFLPGVVALHLLYYCYSSGVFALCCMAHAFSRRKETALADGIEFSG
ncbi:MAG TPA: glycosyltransferase family A protein [Pyrinomonadaceae bacterium]|jgi:glycosyltransferase involved in cell wall biosynthesis|nr:glycosyltransferase family A protein [Pyrinomonadaceae bacterium]